MPRVLELVTRMNIGGPARHVVHVATELSDRFEIDVAAGQSPPDEGTFADPRVPIHHIDLVRRPAPGRDARAIRQVRRLLRQGRYDILHTHMAKAGTVGRIAALLVRPRPRTIHTFHGHVLDGYFAAPVERAILATERWLARHTDVLVAVSERTRDDLLALGIGRTSQWRVIRPASELAPFFAVTPRTGELRGRHGIPDDAFLVAALGRLVPIKDHETLLRAVADTDAHLLVCGEGPLEPDVRRLAAELGIDGRVHFAGWIADVPDVLGQVDAVVLSSRNEGTPLALVEAQAAGVPVVATDVGGVTDVVAAGETGLLVPPGDAPALAQALRRLSGDPELRSLLGGTGRALMRQRYAPSTGTAAIAELYARLIGMGGGR